jgi:hypothetical protein
MKGKEAPHNTAREVQENPLLGIIIAMDGDSGLLAEEARGQRSFIGSDTIPASLRNFGGLDPKTILEAAGMKFLGPVEGDAMFQYVELPKGWQKVATDHSMWSKLVDDKGRERALIFYKAAFYDRSAYLTLSCRYHTSFDYDRFDSESIGVTNITDGMEVIHTTEPILASKGDESYIVSEKTNRAATKWLDKNYPSWRDPSAYWD